MRYEVGVVAHVTSKERDTVVVYGTNNIEITRRGDLELQYGDVVIVVLDTTEYPTKNRFLVTGKPAGKTLKDARNYWISYVRQNHPANSTAGVLANYLMRKHANSG